MASCLLKSECVDLERKLYKMTWWATAINQISVPSGMNMCGGSVAVITTSGGVEMYHYNSSQSAWKKDSSVADMQSDINSLNMSINSLYQQVYELSYGSPQVEWGMINDVEVGANSSATFSVEYENTEWNDNYGDEENPEYPWQVPTVMFSFYTTAGTVDRLAKYEVGITGRTRSGFSGVIKNSDSSARTPVIYWLALTKRTSESDGE